MSISATEILKKYVPFGKPIQYNEWTIYPVSIMDEYVWEEACPLLDIDKNSLNNIDILRMSYLMFLTNLLVFDDEKQMFFNQLMRICLGLDDEVIIQLRIADDDAEIVIGSGIQTKSGRIIIDSPNAKIINSKDFDEIKRIILYQNLIGYTDEYIDPDVKAVVDEYYRLKNKNAPDVSLEQKIAVVQAQTGMSNETINAMTLRGFYQLFNTIVSRVEYPIMKTAEYNGAKFNKPIEHWALRSPVDMYKEAFTGYGEFVDKISV